MTLKVQYYKKAVLVTGAFDVRDVLKSIGGKYVHTLQGWVFSKKRRDAVISRLQSLQGVDVVDETADTAATDRSTASASANANANSGGAMSSSARGARSSASANDDYSDLASLPTPNKDKFADGVPGESKVRSFANYPDQVINYHIVDVTENGGYTLRVESLAEKKERQIEEECRDEDPPAGYYEPRISVVGSRNKTYKKKEFTCDGTMFRHTILSWVDAPIKFQEPHRVKGRSPVERICHEEKIEDLTPFDCAVYWKPITEQCKSCHDADKAFEQWVKRASSTGGQAALALAGKKRKAEEVTEGDDQRKVNARKGNLKAD